jgi:serine/threonine protein phosphatase 1
MTRERSADRHEDIHFRILRMLEKNPKASQREIAEELGVSLGGVNYCLNALVEKGLISGNHEEVLLATAEGNRRAAALFHKLGGRETLLSYGAGAQDYDYTDTAGIIDLTRIHIPSSHLQWMRGLRNSYLAGDYLFVHAGLCPGIAVEDQKPSDMRWNRTEFLEHAASHGPMVIHGHSMSSTIDERPNRVGIDTGAYASGILSAIGLEGNRRWFLQTRP